MAVFSFLFHTVEDFFSFTLRLRIHATFLNFLFELSGVGNIFRMHFIQFFLQVINLFFNCSFTVKLFLIPFLGFLCFIGDFGNFHEFIDCIFNQFTAVTAGICLDNRIFFFWCNIQIFR